MSPAIWNSEAFSKKYKDPNFQFFAALLVKAKSLLERALGVVERALHENKSDEWSRTIFAIKSIANDMCFSKLYSLDINQRIPSQSAFNDIKATIIEILEYDYSDFLPPSPKYKYKCWMCV